MGGQIAPSLSVAHATRMVARRILDFEELTLPNVYMRKTFFLAGFIMLVSQVLCAQDEGTIVKRERIERENSLYLLLGPSFTLGKNIGDYSAGFNFELGYTKRINRIFS